MGGETTGMANAIASLSTTVSSDALWGIFGQAIPYLGVVVLVGFGFYLVRRMIKKISKGKAGI